MLTERKSTTVPFNAIVRHLEKYFTSGFGFGLLLAWALSATATGEEQAPSPEDLLRRLPAELTASIPEDIDRDLLAKYKAQKQLPRQHLLFDILSWREFVAVCWPVDAQGEPFSDHNHSGTRRFETWKTDDDTFLPDGSQPRPWGQNYQNVRFAAKGIRPGVRALNKLNAVVGVVPGKPPQGVGDVVQAFASPIWDQHGWMVRYEIYLNRDEFDYIVANELYNFDGQIAFSQAGKNISFPVNQGQDKVGAMELKLAWKVLDESQGDITSRFLTTKGIIFTGADGKQPQERLLGMVGMHITHKTKSSPQWIWSTFMHVDSLDTDLLELHDDKPLRPLFRDPYNEIALINAPSETLPRPPDPDSVYHDGKPPTQVLSLTPAPPATERVNRVARQALRERKSVLQFYTLVGSQWPTDPSAAPSDPTKLPDSINNKPGGRPTPVYLVNPLLETYFQLGNQPASNQEERNDVDPTQVFGTESCMGCHSSARVATGISTDTGMKQPTFAGQLSGDFSWLLERRAHFKK